MDTSSASCASSRHEAQALRRERRIERHVGGTGLENAEHGGEHVGAALDAQAHPLAAAHAARTQRLRHAVGARLQLGIRERARPTSNRRALGRAPDLCLK